jgi:hypothetical protein
MNGRRTLARQFVQFPIALVCARDVGRVLLSSEPEGMAVENDINIFREALNDLVDLGQRGSAFEERARQVRTQEDSVKRPADPEIFFHDYGRTHLQPGRGFAEDDCALRAGSWAK